MKFKDYLNEGIDIDYRNNTVSFNDFHERDVDTSLKNNPVKSKIGLKNINVWSIFTRKDDTTNDGNPLIYALKGERGWKFKDKNDKEKLYERFAEITKKFAQSHNFNVSVLIPSSNKLNSEISKVISEVTGLRVIEDLFLKLTTLEVLETIDQKDSKFKLHYKDKTEEALNSLMIYIKRMDKEKGGKFARHFIKDNEMRNVIDNTLTCYGEYWAEYAKDINDKDILLIDDTISRGQTIKEACNAILDTYNPKSITVLTLFSKKFK